MLSKTINVLKSNPVLIIFYIAYMAVSLAAILLFFPMDFNQAEPLAVLARIGQMMLVSIVLCAFALLFFAGYGHMISESVMNGKTTAQCFLTGIKKYIGRVLLTALLLFVFYIGVSIVMSIIIVPITIIFAANSAGDPTGSAATISILFMVIIMGIIIFALPFVLLWYPAIFIDDTNTIEGLKRGARAGVKCYWKLVPAILVLYIPTTLYFLIESPFNMQGTISYGPAYYASITVTSLLAMVFLPYLFVLYNKIKPQLFKIQS